MNVQKKGVGGSGAQSHWGNWCREISVSSFFSTTFAYDADNRQISQTDQLGHTSASAYEGQDWGHSGFFFELTGGLASAGGGLMSGKG
jgi:hypothetical protein